MAKVSNHHHQISEQPLAAPSHQEHWSAHYEAELAENPCETPARLAEALWSVLPQADAPLLDYGCGAGLSGLALRRTGFTTLDGVERSQSLMDLAALKGAYRSLDLLSGATPPRIKPGTYRAILACTTLGADAEPPELFGKLMMRLRKGGYFAFSYNDQTLADHSYSFALNEWLDCGAARLLIRAYGPHLPDLNLNSTIYVIEKT